MPRMTKKLAKKLQDAVEPINNMVDCLNNGGCGVVAVEYARLLQEMGFEGIEIWSLTSRKSEDAKDYHSSNVRKLQEAKSNNNTPAGVAMYNHYMVRFKDWFFDSETAIKIKEDWVNVTEDRYIVKKYPVGAYSVEDIDFANGFQFLWNRRYHRSQNGIVKDYFTSIKNKFV